MNASIIQAQKTLGEPENAFLTGKNALPHNSHGGGGGGGGQKRGGMLPSLEKERCLSCNSTLRDPAANSHSGGLVNKNPHQMTPVYGGGFALGSPAPADKGSANRGSSNNNNHNHSAPYLPGAAGSGSLVSNSSSRIASLSDSTSEGCVLCVRSCCSGAPSRA